jgi:iron(III) transport system ATP-binding protein
MHAVPFPTVNAAPTLELQGVTRRFGPVVALDDASLTVAPGEILGVLGPSGCGKTTLLNLIAGHLQPDSGRIAISGQVVADATTLVPAQRRRVAMVFQDFALFPQMTALENVRFALPKDERRGGDERARDLLRILAVDDLADRRPAELSGGQQQRIALARALAQRPDLVLLDEPFSSLDQGTRDEVRAEIIGRLRETGITCLVVTHDQEEALSISDRVAVLHEGRVLQVDRPEVLYRKPFCSEVADFIGRANVLDGEAAGERVRTPLGTYELLAAAEGPVRVFVRPELVGVRRDAAGEALVEARDFRGHDVVYTLRLDDGTRALAHRPSVEMVDVGDRVRIEPQPGYAALVPVPFDQQSVAR